MYKRSILFPLLFIISICIHAQNPTVQDCLGAIPLFQTIYYQDSSFSGEGNIPNEISTAGCPASCLLSGEINDVWYIFTVQATGNLCFNIIPNSAQDDFDWAVFNLTNATCGDIFSDISLMVSCNFSAQTDTTGANGLDSSSCAAASDGKNNALIPVSAGETYVLNVSNYSQTHASYILDFSCTDSSIVTSLFSAGKPPQMPVSIYPNPAADEVSVVFDTGINQDCSITVFDITGKPVITRKIEKESCIDNSTFTFSVAALQTGSYVVVLFVENVIAGRVPMVVIR